MENILIEKQDNIAIVTINRPTKLNALNKATIQELHDGFQQLNEDKSVKAIIVTKYILSFSMLIMLIFQVYT